MEGFIKNNFLAEGLDFWRPINHLLLAKFSPQIFAENAE